MKSVNASYRRALKQISEAQKILKIYPPGLYLIKRKNFSTLLGITEMYHSVDIIFYIIAVDDDGEKSISVAGHTHRILLDVLYTYKITPVKIRDLPLYLNFASKTEFFEDIIQTGRLPEWPRLPTQ